VRLWRDRWVYTPEVQGEPLPVAQRLQEAPRPGAIPKFTAEHRCQMAALACETPTKAGRPISQWTGREIADERVARGIVTRISPRHAARLLKKGACSHIGFATGEQKCRISNEKRRFMRDVCSILRRHNEPNKENVPSIWTS
jgi:hypothetical protein